MRDLDHLGENIWLWKTFRGKKVDIYLELKNFEFNWEFCHSLTDFIHDTDDYFSESPGDHLFFIVKKLGNSAKIWFPHLGMMCNQNYLITVEQAIWIL